MLPPPPPVKKTPYPEWALNIGAKLQEDQGGKYYEMEHTVVTKVYVYPQFKVEMPNGQSYCRKPRNYKNKGVSRKENAVSPIQKRVKKPVVPDIDKVDRKVKTEVW